MNKLRLLIAKWALKPETITLADFADATGIDVDKLISQKVDAIAERVIADKFGPKPTKLPGCYV